MHFQRTIQLDENISGSQLLLLSFRINATKFLGHYHCFKLSGLNMHQNSN